MTRLRHTHLFCPPWWRSPLPIVDINVVIVAARPATGLVASVVLEPSTRRSPLLVFWFVFSSSSTKFVSRRHICRMLILLCTFFISILMKPNVVPLSTVSSRVNISTR